MILPTIEDAYEQAVARRSRVLSRVQNKTLKVKAGDPLRPALRQKRAAAEAQPAASSEAAPPPAAPAAPKVKARAKAKAKAAARTSVPRIRKVLITAIEMVEEALRRQSTVA